MVDPLWRCLDSSRSLKREQLELVIQKKKINEVFSWFHEHFIKCAHAEYRTRCPIVIIQGPTGCGKTSTLRWIANELKLPIKEYSETTDITEIDNDVAKPYSEEERTNLSHSISRRKALKFEHFVVNNIHFNPLWPPNDRLNSAESEFDSDGYVEIGISNQAPPASGIIIHIETPLGFAKSQRVLVQCLYRLIKVIRDMSKLVLRRVAIVFETLEGDSEIIALPTKIKLALGIQVFKFNSITRANMKKLIESLVRNYKHFVIDKDTVDQIVIDCDGDMRACVNTLQLICNKSNSVGSTDRAKLNRCEETGHALLPLPLPTSKKQKLHHEKVIQIKLNPGLMRDKTRSIGFFHILGKIFYQKRLYPDPNSIEELPFENLRSIDRPYPLENTTDYLANMLDGIESSKLIAWLHHHYYRFCRDSDLEKADSFLDNLSVVDTTSLCSTQMNQFYEMHSTIDQLQIYLAIESTVFSLYEDQTHITKASHKKAFTEYGYKIVKTSVEHRSTVTNGELYSFKKPLLLDVMKLTEDYKTLFDYCMNKMKVTHVEPQKVQIDYMSYMGHLINNWNCMSPLRRSTCSETYRSFFEDETITKVIEALNITCEPEVDLECRHDTLLDLIEEIELTQDKKLIESL